MADHDHELIVLTPSELVLPPLIAAAGPQTARRFVEFFTANIRNENTREAYSRNISAFLAWCGDEAGTALDMIEPVVVAAYIEKLLRDGLSKPTVKQHLAAIRMLFDWMVTGGVLAVNPAAAVRGPKYVIKKGKTPVLTPEEARLLLDSIDLTELSGLRDRAYLDAYLKVAGIADQKGTPLWRSMTKERSWSDSRMARQDVFRMVKRRCKQAELGPAANCHTFRATGITAYLLNGGSLEHPQAIAAHESPRTTKLNDRTSDEITLDAIERIGI